jgi:ribokinase
MPASGVASSSAVSPAVSPAVVVVGSLNMDLVATAAHIPAPGETVLGNTLRTLHGGKGANQAVAAARLGAPVTMIGRVGADAYGPQLRDELSREGIDTTWIGTCKHDPSGVALITVADTGENCIVVVPGANGLLRAVHVDDAFVHPPQPGSVMVLQLEVPLDVVLHAAKLGRQHQLQVVLNPAPVAPLPEELWSYVDVLIVNEHECSQLGGVATLCQLVPHVVTTLGGDGVVVYERGTEPVSIAAQKVAVVDTTGAGDAFVGALAAQLAFGVSLQDAAIQANTAAGLSVTKLGARTSPTSAELAAV